LTCLVGALALIGFPGTAGFFSKDALIDAVHESHRMGSGYAYFCVLTGVFITALYTFRMFFHDFPRRAAHGPPHEGASSRESLGGDGTADHARHPFGADRLFTVKPMLFGGYFDGAIHVLPANDVLGRVGEEFHGPGAFMWSAFAQWPVWFAALGVLTAWWFFSRTRLSPIRRRVGSNGCTRRWSINTVSIGSTNT